MNQKIIFTAFLVILVIGIIGYFVLTKNKTYSLDGIEDGGYIGTAFCNLINHTSFELKDHLITIEGEGPFEIKINKMRNIFSPYEYPKVKLIASIRFGNKNISYADGLYFGNDNNLYECHGGK